MSTCRKYFASIAIGLVIVSLAAAGGCNALDFVPLASATKTLSEDFKTSNSPRITIDTFNGTIDVSRGGDGEVTVDVTKRASGFDAAAAEAALDSVQVTMVQKDNTIEITARRLDNRPGNFGASVVIAVPAASQLNLESSNGGVVCEEVEGKIEAQSSNGKLEIIGGKGPIKLSTSNGSIDVEATAAVVDAHSSNGRIQFRGTLADAKHHFETSNGRIELVLPDDAQFRLSADTSNSRIECDFEVSGRKRRTEIDGVVGGNPGTKCSIEADTSNGSIAVRKASGNDRD